MRKALNLVAAASLAAAGFAFMGYDSAVLAADRETAQVTASSGSFPQGVTRSDRADQAGVRRTLSGVVNAILTGDGNLSSLDTYLARNDANRVTRADQNDNRTALHNSVEKLRQDYKAKYNRDLNLDGEMAFGDQFKNFVIVQGEVSNPALMSNWPVDATGHGDVNTRTETRTETHTTTGNDVNRVNDGKRNDVGGPGSPATDDHLRNNAGNNQHVDANANLKTGNVAVNDGKRAEVGGPGNPPTGVGTNNGGTGAGAAASGEMRMDRGMNVAIATFPASHNAPEINVSLLRETSATIHSTGGAQGNAGGVNSTAANDGKRADVGGPGNPPTDRTTTAGGTSANGNTAGKTGTTTGVNANASVSDWKVDLPNTMTADRIEKNLAMHLNEVDQMKDHWPADSGEAYRMISHHIFMALYDVNSNAGASGAGLK